ncbi:hypothetical protein BaRGS_00034799 [Batillaria attramentaria]|uniref:Uncharacterized protein n=1 Tax=Batillaria attramentaria TaxID=370345 RepID=A0ABD0JGR2_9CAEN
MTAETIRRSYSVQTPRQSSQTNSHTRKTNHRPFRRLLSHRKFSHAHTSSDDEVTDANGSSDVSLGHFRRSSEVTVRSLKNDVSKALGCCFLSDRKFLEWFRNQVETGTDV